MYQSADMALWRGRTDDTETTGAERWHQVVRPFDQSSDKDPGIALVGFACDEGVRRNQGRPGARCGPAALRAALAGLACARQLQIRDAGDVVCENGDLERAQHEYADIVTRILEDGHRVIGFGGGHEIAVGSFLGLLESKECADASRSVGIVNLDAHFDLRSPAAGGNSGTPFRQVAQWCEEHERPFQYMVLGINPAANTRSLFQYAVEHDVHWLTDLECTADRLPVIERSLVAYIAPLDELYLSICLDVLPASYAPGVSAPGSPGVDPRVVIDLVQTIKALCIQHDVALRVFDVAELNPAFDLDNRTARLAARLIHEFVT